MEPIEWMDSFSVGVEVLDSDHRRLIDIINRIEGAGGDRVSAEWILDELRDFARSHFHREEEMLEAVKYPHLGEQVEEHRQFVEWLGTLTNSLPRSGPFHGAVTEAVSNYLKLWLTDHILVSDMAYKKYLT